MAEKAANVGGSSSNNSSNGNGNGNNASSGNSTNINNKRCRSGYYLGSRKISLTCHSRPLVDAATGTVTAALAVTAMPTPAAKLEVKRKTNARLRSPGPSPPTISPSSSPNRSSRFHVSRVNEIGSPATSPLAQLPPQHSATTTTPRSASSCMSIPMATGGGSGVGNDATNIGGSQSSLNSIAALPLPTSSSLPSMACVTSSTQTIKRLSVSPRSRFHVSRIYEEPQTPPMNLPPTPMLKSARKVAAQLAESTTLSHVTTIAPHVTTAMPISSVIIVEPIQPPPNVNDNENKAQNSTNNKVQELELGQEKEQEQEQQQQQEKEEDAAVLQKLSPQLGNNSPNTSSSSCSSSPISSSSSASASTSSSCSSYSSGATTNSCSDVSSEGATTNVSTAPAKTCPIAVFGDNDITLTKDSIVGVALSAVAGHSQDAAAAAATITTTTTSTTSQPTAARARKASWIANPTTVDKLLTLFNPSSMFQRSSSPESKTNPAPLTNNAQS